MQAIKDIFEELAATASTLQKRKILTDNMGNEDLFKMLNYLLNPFVVTGISKKKISKQVNKEITQTFGSFFELMDYIAKNNTGTDEIIANIQNFLRTQEPKLAEFFVSIITKADRKSTRLNSSH